MYSIGSITIDLNLAATIAAGILAAFAVIQVYNFIFNLSGKKSGGAQKEMGGAGAGHPLCGPSTSN